ncbi:unnamed protein product [Arabis nemorensis]|uniref:Uncharacterized protein n=1 Tax=Arabis nemorensis TaxID=586526 RepID=A0A565BSM2_9BRAS|nr:unnamed protein product [Arabis nemorensis]
MQMGKLVRLLRGIWVKAETGEWDFKYDPSDRGFRVMVRKNETFTSLMGVVRTRYLLVETTPIVLTYQCADWMLVPDERKTPLVNILTDSDGLYYMAARNTYPQLPIYATVGPEAVASYQYQCRAPFIVNGRSYVVPGANQGVEETTPEYDALTTGPTLVGTRGALEEIFTEAEMLILHRVHMEMTRSHPNTNLIDNLTSDMVIDETLSRNEVIDVDDGLFSASTVHGGGNNTNSSRPQQFQSTQEDCPLSQQCHEFGDVGLGLLGNVVILIDDESSTRDSSNDMCILLDVEKEHDLALADTQGNNDAASPKELFGGGLINSPPPEPQFGPYLGLTLTCGGPNEGSHEDGDAESDNISGGESEDLGGLLP